MLKVEFFKIEFLLLSFFSTPSRSLECLEIAPVGKNHFVWLFKICAIVHGVLYVYFKIGWLIGWV